MASPIGLYAAACIVPLFFIFWLLSATSPSSPITGSFPTLRNKRICLLIAHPDDEAMFFAPTLLALTKPELGNHVKILCLSSGDADGLGHIRKKELRASALRLGLRNESDVFVVDDPSRFADSMTTTWAANDISSLLASAFAPDLVSPTSQAETSSSSSSTTRRKANGAANHGDESERAAPTATIDVLLTFDASGVSNHPNHRSLYHGARTFLTALMKGKAGYSCPVTLYSLTSTFILRKYIGVLDAPVSMFQGVVGGLFNLGSKKDVKADKAAAPRLIYVSGMGDWMTAWNAMVKAHQSQMVWFRWGWITLGRYMVVNDLKREKV